MACITIDGIRFYAYFQLIADAITQAQPCNQAVSIGITLADGWHIQRATLPQIHHLKTLCGDR